MANIVLATWDGGGNLPPALGIAAELQRRGNVIRILGHEQQRSQIERAGLRFEPYRQASPFSSTAAKPGLRWITAMSTLVRDRNLGADLTAIVQQEPADLVIVDCALPTVLAAAEQTKLRRVVLIHSFLAIGSGCMDTGGPIARLRGSQTIRPGCGADLALVATLRRLDPAGHKEHPADVQYTGPVWQSPPRPATPASGPPHLLVSLSTCWFPGQVQVLQNVLDAISELPVTAIVTTGPAVSPADLRAPANAELHQYVPHTEVLPTVSMVVGHGGHATTMAALAHDLPVVVLPLLKIMDQRAIGQAVQAAGAGRLLTKRTSPKQIRTVIADLLADDNARRAAAQCGVEIRQRDGAATAADAIAQILPA
jgi:UDP:flavonoid glycosyltransferase YjiC (YdhE family)